MPVSPQPAATFRRSQRLKESRDFQRAKTKGQRLPCGCLIANWYAAPGLQITRLGLVTSKQVGPAVVRNRARRLMRECYRLHQHELIGPLDLVLVARPSMARKSWPEIEHDFLKALRKANLLKTSKP